MRASHCAWTIPSSSISRRRAMRKLQKLMYLKLHEGGTLDSGCIRDIDPWTFQGSSYYFLTRCISDIYVARIHDSNSIMRDRRRQHDVYLDACRTNARLSRTLISGRTSML